MLKIYNTQEKQDFLKEAINRVFSKLYLKTDLVNYYEKFRAVFIENLNNGEKLYFFNL